MTKRVRITGPGTVCTVKNCLRIRVGLGLCGLHWYRFHKKGSVAHFPRCRLTVPERIAASSKGLSVKQCWPWKYGLDSHGYGRTSKYKGECSAHRVSYKMFAGKIPRGLFVLHKCDNPPCFNPNHLFLGDHADNGRDMAEKERSRHTFLTKKDVLSIRGSRGISQFALAEKYGVDQSTISKITHNKRWKHL